MRREEKLLLLGEKKLKRGEEKRSGGRRKGVNDKVWTKRKRKVNKDIFAFFKIEMISFFIW